MVDKAHEMVDKLIDYASRQKNTELLNHARKRADQALRKHTAVVKHVGVIDEVLKTQLVEAVKDRFAEAREVVFEEDASLIGGIQVVFQDYRYEGSVRGRFERVKAQFS